ncbi:polyadenylate-binding RBP47B [Olea europaea subsp. europaea]|uniref:Polyadenylate-binding RBP47B n=1 Tax=Olea europaea subsp. europaea TaxID=158383 RepID=A0A8S0V4Z0_OLEEU|nr:polyadenylate-binding RBP47B [Olea europaea subsp. europaea]
MTEMNGVYCSTRPMRISAATPKKSAIGVQQQYAAPKVGVYPAPIYTPPVRTVPVDNDINNTTVFIPNLDPNVTEEELKQIFLQFREIISIKIPDIRRRINPEDARDQSADPMSQWTTLDPSAYAYSCYLQYTQHAEGAQDMAAMLGVVSTMEHREEIHDPLTKPDADKLNATYLAVHGSTILGCPLWQRTSALS